jgi:class 3 adenylate cyclase/tetratricopeptide (TPR) repeat protein
MRCPQCHQENSGQARFCTTCGTRLARACAKCTAALPAGAAFCHNCGHATGAATAGTSVPAGPPGAYTPKGLAEKILTSKAALEGERKQVTVLFADMKGSMELLADRDPEESRAILDPVLEQMMAAIHAYEGMVNQVMGDGIMALFGAPLAHEDHAVRACFAALRMQESIARFASGVFRSHGVSIQVRVGLNSGEVVVRAISSDLHMDYTAVGETTHLAARMEQLAVPGTILVTAQTLRLAEGYVETRPRGPVDVKGMAGPVEVHELLGASPSPRWRLHGVKGTPTPLVGRAAELAELRRQLERAASGQGQIVAVVGEPGLGKTRLVVELTRSPAAEGLLILEAGTASYTMSTAWLPVVELLRRYLGLEGGADLDQIRDTVRRRLQLREIPLDSALSPLLWLLGDAPEEPEWRALDAAHRRFRAVDALKRLLLRESAVQPLLLVFEDLHWLDDESQGFLDGLAHSIPTARILLLVSYRPEYRHRWGGRASYHLLRVDPLSAATAGELLESLLGTDPSLRAAKQLLVDRGDGNPFFLEESVRTLVETRVLAGSAGAFRLDRPLHGTQVPASVQAVLAARIDRLAPGDKEVLQCAAVVGRDVPLAVLRAIVDHGEEALSSALARLQAAELLYETRLFPEVEYTFKHTLTHEVAHGGVLRQRRVLLHGRIVDALVALHPERRAEYVERLAHHATNGERWADALRFSREAGARAFARSALRSAATWFECALEALERLPVTDGTAAQAIDIRLDLRSALSPLGEFGRLLTCLQEAERLATEAGDDRRLGRIASYLANFFQVAGDLARAIEYGHRAVAMGHQAGDTGIQVVARCSLALCYQTLGSYRPAVDLARHNLSALAGGLEQEWLGMAMPPAVYTHATLVRALAELGEFAEGETIGRQGLKLAESFAHPYSEMFAELALGILYLRWGDTARATERLERTLALCASGESPPITMLVSGFLAAAHVAAARPDEALAVLAEAREAMPSLARAPLPRGVALAAEAEARLLIDQLEPAAQAAAASLAAFTELSARGYQAWTLWVIGRVAIRQGAPAGAEESLAHARSMAADLGMRPLAAHCHLAVAELHASLGDAARAAAAEQDAARAYRELGMPIRRPRDAGPLRPTR